MMTNQRLDERVAQLERSLGRWRFITLTAIGIGIIGLFAAAAPVPDEDELKVKKLMVVNDGGDAVVILGSVDGRGSIHILDAKTRAAHFSVGSSTRGGAMQISDLQDKNIFTLSNHGGLPSLAISRNGKRALMLHADEQSAGHISLYAGGTTAAWKAPPSAE